MWIKNDEWPYDLSSCQKETHLVSLIFPSSPSSNSQWPGLVNPFPSTLSTVASSQATLVSVHPKEPPGCLPHFVSSPQSLVLTASGTWGKAGNVTGSSTLTYPVPVPVMSFLSGALSIFTLTPFSYSLSLSMASTQIFVAANMSAYYLWFQRRFFLNTVIESLNPQPSYSVLRILANVSQSILPLVHFGDSNYLWAPLGYR